MATVTKKAVVYPVHELSLNAIKVDHSLQSRVETSAEYMREYSEAMLRGDIFPPVKVIRDQNGNYWLYDGFHRFGATKKIGAKSIRAEVREGTKEDAYVLSAGSNKEFSIKRTSEDLKKAAWMLFVLQEWWSKSDTLIATHIGTTNSSVKRYRLEYSAVHNVDVPKIVEAPSGRNERYTRLPRITNSRLEVARQQREDSRKTFAANANSRLSGHLARHDEARERSIATQTLTERFHSNKLVFKRTTASSYAGLTGFSGYGYAVIESFLGEHETIPSAVGRVLMFRHRVDQAAKCVVLTNGIVRASNGGLIQIVQLAAEMGVEFMTPDEFIHKVKSEVRSTPN